MFTGGLLWVLEHLKCVGLDPLTGEVKRSWQAGFVMVSRPWRPRSIVGR